MSLITGSGGVDGNGERPDSTVAVAGGHLMLTFPAPGPSAGDSRKAIDIWHDAYISRVHGMVDYFFRIDAAGIRRH